MSSAFCGTRNWPT